MKHAVLIIEDNKTIEWIAEALEFANYTVLQATTGQEGFELAQSNTPDLILCNLMLPDFDGCHLLYLISKKPELAVIPFIFLINKTETRSFNRRKVMELGADDFLIEPFYTMELLNAIESRLRKKEREKAFYVSPLKKLDFLPSERGLEEFESLCKTAAKPKNLKKKQTLFNEGDPSQGIYLVVSGLIKTTKRTEDGKEMLTNIYGSQEYLDLTSMLLNKPHHVTAQALEDSSLSLLPKDLVHQLLKKFPDLNRQFFKILIADIWEKEDQIVQLAYCSVRKRVAEVLLRLAKHKNGEINSNPLILEMCADDLASMAGVSKETVSRVLSGFKSEGFIKKDGSYIYLLDSLNLQQIKN